MLKVNPKIKINSSYSDKRWKVYPNPKIEQLVDRSIALSNKLKQQTTLELEVNFSNKSEVRELNRVYRNKDKDTNVLSFQYINWSKPILSVEFLGDIIFSYDAILQESTQKNIAFDDHLSHLLVHGVLHLLGFDHQKDTDAETMENLEVRILKEFGMKSPYGKQNE